MSIIVQKYGGSSVADVEKIREVAARVKARKQEGHGLVVVVSAMGDTTDELLALARKVSRDPPRRELDMLLTCGERISMALLSMALQELGVPAISFTGSQSGIITNDAHAQARIVEVRPYRIQDELALGKVVIVAGYQGVSYKREVTTLGRGGSDTTAVALAAALGALACEIYSDVDGVFTADPRLVPDARKLEQLSYEEMQALASTGARVLNAQAVEFARHKGIAILARASAGGGQGTVVTHAPEAAAGGRVKGVSAQAGLAVLTANGGGALLGELLEFLDARGVHPGALSWDRVGAEAACLLIPLEDVHGVEALGADLQTRFGERVRLVLGKGSVSCVGVGINADGAALRRALTVAEPLATVHAVQTSSLHLSLVVDEAHLPELTRRLHHAFGCAQATSG
jgi:aspartate kinase